MRKLIGGQYVAVSGSAMPTAKAAKPARTERQKMTLPAALAQLDPKDEVHWNKSDGKPDLRVLTEYVGRRVSRAEVDKAAPLLTRDAAAQKSGK